MFISTIKYYSKVSEIYHSVNGETPKTTGIWYGRRRPTAIHAATPRAGFIPHYSAGLSILHHSQYRWPSALLWLWISSRVSYRQSFSSTLQIFLNISSSNWFVTLKITVHFLSVSLFVHGKLFAWLRTDGKLWSLDA